MIFLYLMIIQSKSLNVHRKDHRALRIDYELMFCCKLMTYAVFERHRSSDIHVHQRPTGSSSRLLLTST